MPESKQFVDELVTARKFDQEFAQFQQRKEEYRKEGVFLLEKRYPDVYFAFAPPLVSPSPLLFAVRINYTNYDVIPLSVKFVNPFTLEPVLAPEVHTHLVRKIVVEDEIQGQRLVQAQNDQVPFICFAGIREYHEHPRHTDDPWLLHRGNGEGNLCFLLDNLSLYGLSAIRGYSVQGQFTINGSGQVLQVILPRIQVLPSKEYLSE